MSTVTCPSCQCETVVEPSWKYCTKCGSRLTMSNQIEAARPAVRPASSLGYGSPEAVRRSPTEAPSAPASTIRKPGKPFMFLVAVVFCFGGAVAGGLVGLFLHFKGPDLTIAGIAAGSGAAYEYLRRRGAFPSKKKQ